MELRYYQREAIDAVWPPEGRKLIVIPTGGGKSLTMAKIINENLWLTGRVLLMAHVKELLVQNAMAIIRDDPLADIGIVCAGIKRENLPDELKDALGRVDAQITVASVQSIYRKLDYWQDVGLLLIDEAHRITPVGGKLYRAVLEAFPGVPLVGLTATPFRVGTGYLHKGEHALFDEISYEISMAELVENGYLVPFATKGSDLAYQDDGLRKTAGEFNQADLDKLVQDGAKTRSIVSQFTQRARERQHWLIFAMNVRHAQMIRDELATHGQTAGIIYDGMHEEGLDRDEEIELFRMGIYRALINVNVLTTGFDFPALDCVILMRPIGSPVLFIQCIGRGTRLSHDTGKKDCLVLDYGGNVARHGDFSNPNIKEATKAKKTKECPSVECGEMNSAGARYCAACLTKFPEMFKRCVKCETELDRSATQCKACGYTYPINETRLDEEGSTIIGNTAVWIDIKSWKPKVHVPYERDNETQRPNSVVIKYRGVDGCEFREYVFPESKAARHKFELFWKQHELNVDDETKRAHKIPKTAEDAVTAWNTLKTPRRVKVVRVNQYHQVLARDV